MSAQNLGEETAALKRSESKASPEERVELRRQIDGKLAQIEQLGDESRNEPKDQIEVARSFITADEPTRALKRAEMAVQLAPRDPEARAVRATTLAVMKRYEEAAQDARIALKLDPGNREAAAVLRLTAGRSSGGVVRAAEAATAPAAGAGGEGAGAATGPAKAARPDFSGAQSTADRLKADELLGQAAGKLGLGDAAAALPLLDRAVALDPKNAKALAARARARLAADGTAEGAAAALTDARQAVALGPKEAQAHLALAHALKASGAPSQEVLDELKAAVELDPTLSTTQLSALARRGGGSGGAAGGQSNGRADDASLDAGQGGSATALILQRLPIAARRHWPWLAVAVAVLAGGWLWLTKRQVE